MKRVKYLIPYVVGIQKKNIAKIKTKPSKIK